MSAATLAEPTPEAVETRLRDELAQGDAVLSAAPTILRHLLVNDDRTLLNDEIVARVRGMLSDVARQLLRAQTEAGQIADLAPFVAEREAELADALVEDPAFLAHVHALAVEGRLTLQLQARGNSDSMLCPLLQELVASRDDAVAGDAMAVLTAQARFIQDYRRMALPVGELPADLLHRALLALRTQAGGRDDLLADAERSLRDSYDESSSRLGLIARLVTRVLVNTTGALDIGQAGLGVFATALAMESGQDRDSTVLSFSERQFVRLALAMRAAGLEQRAIQSQLLYLHPDIALQDGFDKLSADRAAVLLIAARGG